MGRAEGAGGAVAEGRRRPPDAQAASALTQPWGRSRLHVTKASVRTKSSDWAPATFRVETVHDALCPLTPPGGLPHRGARGGLAAFDPAPDWSLDENGRSEIVLKWLDSLPCFLTIFRTYDGASLRDVRAFTSSLGRSSGTVGPFSSRRVRPWARCSTATKRFVATHGLRRIVRRRRRKSMDDPGKALIPNMGELADQTIVPSQRVTLWVVAPARWRRRIRGARPKADDPRCPNLVEQPTSLVGSTSMNRWEPHCLIRAVIPDGSARLAFCLLR